MRIVIFGATGDTGQELVVQALGRGYEVVAFVRSPEKLPFSHRRLRIARGDGTEYSDVDSAIAGADVVLSALGHGRKTPPGMQTKAIRNILRAMEKHNVDRLIDLTTSGARHSDDNPSVIDKILVALLEKFGSKIINDSRNHAREIRNSGLDWVIARATRLTKGAKTGTYQSSSVIEKSVSTRISRADMADFMLDQITEDTYVGSMPYVGK